MPDQHSLREVESDIENNRVAWQWLVEQKKWDKIDDIIDRYKAQQQLINKYKEIYKKSIK